MPRSYDRFCPLSLALDEIGDRWTLLLVYALLDGPARYSDLDRFVSGAGGNVVTERLRRLVNAGLVGRTTDTSPGTPTVYALTERGLALAPIIAELSAWGIELLAPADSDQLPEEGRLFDQTWTTRPHGPRHIDETYQWHIGDTSFAIVVTGERARQVPGTATDAVVTLTTSRELLKRLLRGQVEPEAALASGELKIRGPADAIERMLAVTGFRF